MNELKYEVVPKHRNLKPDQCNSIESLNKPKYEKSFIYNKGKNHIPEIKEESQGYLEISFKRKKLNYIPTSHSV